MKHFFAASIRVDQEEPGGVGASFSEFPLAHAFGQEPDAMDVQQRLAQFPAQRDSAVSMPHRNFGVDRIPDFGLGQTNPTSLGIVPHGRKIPEIFTASMDQNFFQKNYSTRLLFVGVIRCAVEATPPVLRRIMNSL